MGGNQVKATHYPLLHVEPLTLSSQESQERRFRKQLPRQLGSMLLADWVRLKRREQDVITKGKLVVSEGRIPPEIVKELEMYMKSASKKPYIKYHPKIIAPKAKARPRLKGPRLTQTAARRIQDSYDKREREQQEKQEKQEKATQKRGKSRLSVRSHGWTDQDTSRASRRTTPQQQTRASSLPPTITLSLQSITTAESSGIGMSRASSLTSVSSIRHKKPFFTRQRVSSYSSEAKPVSSRFLRPPQPSVTHGTRRKSSGSDKVTAVKRLQVLSEYKGQSLDADDTGGENPRPVQQRSGKRKSPLMVKHSSPIGHSPTTENDTKGKQRWKTALRQSFQQVMQQKARKQTGPINTKQVNKQQRTSTTKEDLDPQMGHSGSMEVKHSTLHNQQQQGNHHPKPQGDGEVTLHVPESGRRASNSSQGEDQRSVSSMDKKEQGSQTRLSGPPRPRRLLLLRPGKNKVKQEEEQKEEPQGQQKPGFSVLPKKINPKEKWKRLLGINKKDTKSKDQEEVKTSVTSNQYRIIGQPLHATPDVPRRGSTDVNTEHTSGQRRHSQPIGGFPNQGENPESISPSDPHHLTTGGERIIRVSRHSSPIDGGEMIVEQQTMRRPVQQQTHQVSTSYEVEPHQHRRSSSGYQVAEDQGHQSQGDNALVMNSSNAGYSETVLIHNGSRRSSGEQGIVESDGHQGKLNELHQSDDQSAGWPGRGVEGRSSNPEERMAVRPLGTVDQGRIVEALGSRRPGSFAGRGQELIYERGPMSAMSLDHGIHHAPLESRLVTERGSPDRIRQRDSLIEYGSHEHPVEILHGEAPIRATERIHRGGIVERVHRDSSTERLHRNSLERGRRESLVEYQRLDGPMDRVRPDVPGRGAVVLGERNGDRMLPRVTHERPYFQGRLDRGYSYDGQDGRGRQYQERRYTVGTVEPSYLGAYTERQIVGRLSEPDSSRMYSGRIPYSRALDSEPARSRSIDYESARPYSEGDFPARVMDHESAKVYAERLVAGGRVRGTEDHDMRERAGPYRDAVITQHSTIASAPLVDHRSL
ncbi:hypothetical protein GWK47_032310 [Chionoecetes opilio]|uniref:Uncharacterized protein n=1 Tax=Chionoecetes opilio TaxID=41210 RepID=A0A8J5D4G6_CHIOP|nr:hypothetical protein GWK47_032310 [Chionoecetes opilio]